MDNSVVAVAEIKLVGIKAGVEVILQISEMSRSFKASDLSDSIRGILDDVLELQKILNEQDAI